MKRYLLFSGINYYPNGGWSDFNTDSKILTDLQKIAKTFEYDWWHIVDTYTMKIVDRGHNV